MTALWTFSPDWSEPVTETIQWLTDVQTADDGTEQRVQLRAVPRRTLSFSVMLTSKEDAQQLEAWLHRHQTEQVHMPVWTDGCVLRVPGDDTNSIPVPDVLTRDYVAGNGAVLLHRDGTHAVREVTGVSSDSITVDESVSWSPGTRVYPLRLANVSQRQQVDRITGGVVGCTCVAYFVGDTSISSAPWSAQYRDRDLLDLRPNRVVPVNATYIRLSETIDHQVGPWIHFNSAGRPFVARVHDYLLDNRHDIDAVRRWLGYVAGRRSSAWVPNWQADLTVIEDIGASDDTIDVARINYGDSFADLVGRTDIMIRLRDGRAFLRRITGSQVMSNTVERLELDAPLGDTVAASAIAQVCWLDQARLGSDDVTLTWISGGVARLELPVRSILEELILAYLTQSDVDFRNYVLVAATANVDVAAPGDTFDSVVLSNPTMRVLLPHQDDATENGLYDWHGPATPLTRTSDTNTDALVNPGLFGLILRGETYGRHLYHLDNLEPITLGTTELDFRIHTFDGITELVAGNAAITTDGNSVSFNRRSNSGITIVGGAGVGAGPGIKTTGTTTSVDLLTDGGLVHIGEGNAAKLAVDVGTALKRGAGGVEVDLMIGGGLFVDSNKLFVLTDSGIAVTASGLVIALATNSGLEFTGGLLRIGAGNGLFRDGGLVHIGGRHGLTASGSNLDVNSWTLHEWTAPGGTATLPSTPITASMMLLRATSAEPTTLIPMVNRTGQSSPLASPYNSQNFYTQSGTTITFGAPINNEADKVFAMYLAR